MAPRLPVDRRTNKTYRAEMQFYEELFGLQRTLTGFGVFSMQEIFRGALNNTYGEMVNVMKAFVQVTGGSITRNREGRIKRLHKEVADDALIYMLRSYSSRGSGITSQPVRSDLTDKHGRPQRDAGGRLEKALASPKMYRVARDGLDFIDPVWLDSQARQWYRINFGAGPRASQTKPAQRAKMVVFGTTLPGDVGLTGFGPSGRYFLPPGFWLDRQGREAVEWRRGRRPKKDSFYPLGSAGSSQIQVLQASVNAAKKKGVGLSAFVRDKPTPSLGFAGSRYLDAGVTRIAKTLPLAYTNLMKEWLSEYNSAGSGPFASEAVRVTTKTLKRAEVVVDQELKRSSVKIRALNRKRFQGDI